VLTKKKSYVNICLTVLKSTEVKSNLFIL